MTPERLLYKARAYHQGYVLNHKKAPSLLNVNLGMCPALAESLAGDVWPGPDGIVGTQDDEKNWGCTIKRPLNSVECAALAGTAAAMLDTAGLEPRGEYVEFDGFNHYRWVTDKGLRLPLSSAETLVVLPITPTVGKGHPQRAKAMQDAIVAAGIVPPQASIHCDSDPAKGAYGIWFANFPNDVEAARYYIRILSGTPEKPKQARGVLEQGGDLRQLATAMHRANYFLGKYKKDAVLPDGRTGEQANVDNYVRFISPWYLQVSNAIRGQDLTVPLPPPPPPDPPEEQAIDRERVMGLIALTLAESAREAVDEGRSDGVA